MDSFYSILSTVGVVIAVVLLFNFMIFFHELGHFFAARWRGLYVDRFQIWFGKPLWKKTINGVQWGLGWIPAGGFVSLPQMAPMESIEGEVDLPKDLPPIKPIDKIIVAAAGPIASFTLAAVFAVCVWVVGKPGMDFEVTTVGYIPSDSPAAASGLLPGDKILEVDGFPVKQWVGDMVGVRERIMMGEGDKIGFLVQRPGETSPRLIESSFKIPDTNWWQRRALRQVGVGPASSSIVESVLPGSPAEKAGLKTGDELTHLNGQKIWSPATVSEFAKTGQEMELTVSRKIRNAGKEILTVRVLPVLPINWVGNQKAKPLTGIQWGMGAEFKEVTLHPTPLAQISMSLRWMVDTVAKVAAPKSDVGMQHLSGPVGIASYFYNILQMPDGWKLALWFAVVLNINLAVLNILPIPVVDGGHVVLGFFEIIFRRPVGGRILELVQTGFVFLIMFFFLFVTFKDVGDFFKPKEEKLPPPSFVKITEK
ncbi:MAG: RIP metalloprotease RseP [Akkermansia sp.]